MQTEIQSILTDEIQSQFTELNSPDLMLSHSTNSNEHEGRMLVALLFVFLIFLTGCSGHQRIEYTPVTTDLPKAQSTLARIVQREGPKGLIVSSPFWDYRDKKSYAKELMTTEVIDNEFYFVFRGKILDLRTRKFMKWQNFKIPSNTIRAWQLWSGLGWTKGGTILYVNCDLKHPKGGYYFAPGYPWLALIATDLAEGKRAADAVQTLINFHDGKTK